MTRHLSDHDLSTAAAGLTLESGPQEHLGSCLACRAQVTTFRSAIAERREGLEREASERPDQSGAILARIATESPVVAIHRRRRLTRSLAALAATLVMAVGLSYLNRNGDGPVVAVVPTPLATLANHGPVAVEDVLAEMEELLADDTIPGLWAADPISDVDELESLFANPAS